MERDRVALVVVTLESHHVLLTPLLAIRSPPARRTRGRDDERRECAPAQAHNGILKMGLISIRSAAAGNFCSTRSRHARFPATSF